MPDPTPGHGQVVVAVRASTICGSDLRAIYREHLGTGPEAYQGVIAGHEPCGEIVAVGPERPYRAGVGPERPYRAGVGPERPSERGGRPGGRRFEVGDRVVLYHIAGCGLCPDCRRGYMIGCTSPVRAAYGWQRDGGHADFLLAEESTCVALPDALSWLDGACVACGFGTAYEALWRAGVSGRDAVLVVGLGPVGMAVGSLAKAMGATLVVGADPVQSRRVLALSLGAVDVAVPAGEEGAAERIRKASGGHGCEVSVDCSGSAPGRALALAGTRRWGRCVFVGEGNRLEVDVSPTLIHRQLTVLGSWVTSVGHMEDLVELLVRWDLHPDRTVTERFSLDDAAAAYATADEGAGGKIAIVLDR